MSDHRPIGVFDSGIGGLTVAAALRRELPSEDLLYLGDTARVPYGSKSAEAITRFACQIAAFLVRHDVKMIIAACNTVSAVALPQIRRAFPQIPVMGVIEAGVQAVLDCGAQSVTVIGTRATIGCDAYRKALHSVRPGLTVDSIACPLLVPLAEEGFRDDPLTFQVLELYLAGVRRHPTDALLLGCTHYPVFRPAMERFFNGKIRIVDSASSCARQTVAFLRENHLCTESGRPGRSRFFLTDVPPGIQKNIACFLDGSGNQQIEKAVLEN